VTFPALDATSKDTAKLSVVLTPEQLVFAKGGSGKLPKNSATQKKWLVSNFRFLIDGLDLKKVSKVDALTIKLPLIGVGDDTVCLKCEDVPPGHSTKIDFPDVVMTVGEPATTVHDWFDDFVISGNNGDEKERSGTLEYLTPNLQTVLFSLKFKNLGIFEVMPVVDPGDFLPRLEVAMYCESMDFVTQYVEQ
jgi:hypothetical protein